MFGVAYVNGSYVESSSATVHVEDRGYQFADGVYEVIQYKNRKFTDLTPHIERLWRSMSELRITPNFSKSSLSIIIKEIVRRNLYRNGLLYIQVTRGVAPRDHSFPKVITNPSLVVYQMKFKQPTPHEREQGVKVVSYQENRWNRCDIKSISLLANVLAKQHAAESNAREAIYINSDGFITEASSSNLHIINDRGEIITHPNNNHILPGVTKSTIQKLAENLQIRFTERPFSAEELKNAKECFLSSTSVGVLPVVQFDEYKISNGKPGEISLRLWEEYDKYASA